MKINEKYNENERKVLEQTMMILALVGAGNAPTTQEEFDAWCEETLAKHYENERKEAEAKAKREARENAPGYKAHRNWKRNDTEIRKMREEIARLEAEIRIAEEKKAYWARKYEEETGKAV